MTSSTALQLLDVGEALNAGIAIVAMAIVLDRVSYAWSLRDRRLKPTIDLLGRSFTRRQAAILAAVVTVAAVLIGREVLRQQVWPESLTVSVADAGEPRARLDPDARSRGSRTRSATG